MVVFSRCPHMINTEKALVSLSLLTRALISSWGPAPSEPNYLSKTLPATTTTLGVRDLAYEGFFWGGAGGRWGESQTFSP